jgi:amino acid transporter/mannitol/fructose-specific phosphotransferase system IIA component (Ntr-type)
MPARSEHKRLKKELGLFDVYAVSTGAMFSSGFFLLPGLAAAQSGPSVILAYLIAGVLIIPAMVSMAELSTAMPRAGGAYYFLDRSLGPLVGTIGGLGTFIALSLKSAFALVGMGAYLAIFIELPVKPLAIAFTVAFLVVNVVGAKETSTLQRILVIILISVLTFFTVQGLFEVFTIGLSSIAETQLTPFMPFGVQGLFATVGLVFVSYAGLTKVASIAEEVKDPDRNLPLGMGLSLLTATFIYVVGVFIMVSVLSGAELRSDLTPVATAGEQFFDWLPAPVGLLLIVIAAIAAFASTGNAGLMSASRYPLAMARDRLLPGRFMVLGRFDTPTAAIFLTAGLMILCIVALDVAGIAKLASAFQLVIFMFVNLAVIVMRESRIVSYVPGYKAPFYPWMQIAGAIAPIFLIAIMGWMAILFTAGTILVSAAWYFHYARKRVARDGAVYHWFERLGRQRDEGLDTELRGILKEKGPRAEDPFEELVARAGVLDLEDVQDFAEIIDHVAPLFEHCLPLDATTVSREFAERTGTGVTPVARGIALPHILIDGIDRPELVLVRTRSGVPVDAYPGADEGEEHLASAFFFLTSPKGDPGLHLRMLAQIARRADDEDFLDRWLRADDASGLKEVVVHDRHFMRIHVSPGQPSESLIGRSLREASLPAKCLVAVVTRNGRSIIPSGNTVLQNGDVLTVIGEDVAIEEARRTYTVPDLKRR